MKYSFDFRLHIVSQVKSGYAIKGLSLAYGLHENKILDWVRLFSLYGEDGLRKQPRTKACVEFKQRLVDLVLEKRVPLSHVIVEYRVSRTPLEGWVRAVRNGGYGALEACKPLGRPPKDMGRPKKKEPESELKKNFRERTHL